MAATFVEVYEVCSYFTSKNNEPRSNELLNGLIHNYGNRNILAASIAMKLPFIMYGFIVFKKGILKYGVLFLVFLSSLSVLLIGKNSYFQLYDFICWNFNISVH